jgi:hypothetical protein
MFECGRCGSSYSAAHVGVEHCPRCQLRDQVQSPLAFKAFQLPKSQSAMTTQPEAAGIQPTPAAPVDGGQPAI